jgi:hypothetical protein
VNSAGLPPPPVRSEPARPPGFPDFELTAPPEPPTVMFKFQPQVAQEEEYETLEVDEGCAAEEPVYDAVAEVATPPISAAEAAEAIRAPAKPPPIPVLGEEPLDAVPVEPSPREVETDDEDDRPRPRRRRRRRRRSGGFSWPTEIIPGVSNFAAVLIILGAVWVLLAGIAVLLPPVGIFLILLGGLVATFGNIWFLIIAFQEDFITGLLCLLLWPYALFFLITNQESAGPPFLVNAIGLLMVGSGIWLVGGLGG